MSAILDEMSYIKIFLARYLAHFIMVVPKNPPSTNGFGFAFSNGSPLVPNISRAIASLREEGKLKMLEDYWFSSNQLSAYMNQDSSGYVWIMTLNSMDHLNFMGSLSSVADSMQGVIGLKSYIPGSDELHNFTSRWRMKLFLSEHNMEAYDMELSAFCIQAYDVACGLAEAVDRVSSKIS
ncbi:hypothetical protein QYF36_001249 [Acer negundo]|nr:hypothetical protein QYF36_001249 [Acer negundo]